MDSLSTWFSTSSKAAKEGINNFWTNNEGKITETKENVKVKAGEVADSVGKAAKAVKEEMGKGFEEAGKAASDMFSFLSTIVSATPSPEDLGLSYVNSRLIAMGFPSTKDSHLGRPIDNISNYLNKKHKGKYMIFNLSEKSYDASKFEQQVMEFKFPGYPSPPLGTLLSILTSMHSWLSASSDNVVIVHCFNGKGRTALILASYLLWTKAFSAPKNAIAHISDRRHISMSRLVVPSQVRYLNYFFKTANGAKLSRKPLRIAKLRATNLPKKVLPKETPLIIEVFENGRLVHRSSSKPNDIGTVEFTISSNIEGDILIRVLKTLELAKSKEGETDEAQEKKEKKVSIFRIAFHTGFHEPVPQKFGIREVDIASQSEDFAHDFALNINFEKGLSSYGKPLKEGNLPASYWEGIQKIAAGPAKVSVDTQTSKSTASDSKVRKVPLSPLDASAPETGDAGEKRDEKAIEKKEQKQVQAESGITQTNQAKGKDDSVAASIKVPADSNQQLADLVRDLDGEEDADEDDDVDEETTAALLQQIQNDDDEDEDDEDLSFEMIKKMEKSSP